MSARAGQDPSELTREVEEVAANAWPAAIVQWLDGWRLRFDRDLTWRSRSVWTNDAAGRQPLEKKLSIVEDFYRRRSEPPRYQICSTAQPAGLDATLASRGYSLHKPTLVQIAALQTVLTRTQKESAVVFALFEAHDERWFDAYAQIQDLAPAVAAARRATMERIGPRRCHALAELDREPVAVGTAVFDQDWLGFFSLATRAALRSRGIGRALMHALARWGAEQGARRAYLQVEQDNPRAADLYGRLGFETLHSYHYRVAPRA